MPYNDLSDDPNEWSNGKWFNAILAFTNYWQNYGRDPTTGSMIGGFRFHYTPMVYSEKDDRVDYGEIYPAFTKNVFLTGNMESSFSDTILKFTMNLAVGQMTSDVSTGGYQVICTSNDSPLHANYNVITPDGLDFIVPERPPEWMPLSGRLFMGWRGSNNPSLILMPGDVVSYSVASKNFTCEAVWGDIDAGLRIIGPIPDFREMEDDPNFDIDDFDFDDYMADGDIEGIGSWESFVTVTSQSITDEDGNEHNGYKLVVKKDALVDMILVGGGGAGAGGTIKTDYALPLGPYASRYAVIDLNSGGGGGAGKVLPKTLRVSVGDVLDCYVGDGGPVKMYKYSSNTSLSEAIYLYGDGSDGGNTVIEYTPVNGGRVTMEATGGKGGTSIGAGGTQWYSGGNGASSEAPDATEGSTAITGCKGIVGEPGEYIRITKESNDILVGKITTFLSHVYGGAGGGASGLFNVLKSGDTYLEDGASGYTSANEPAFRSIGGKGAGKGINANASDDVMTLKNTYPRYGGGGGSGSCGRPGASKEYAGPGYNKPGDGASGLILMQFIER